jgi:hypothetical protein
MSTSQSDVIPTLPTINIMNGPPSSETVKLPILLFVSESTVQACAEHKSAAMQVGELIGDVLHRQLKTETS